MDPELPVGEAKANGEPRAYWRNPPWSRDELILALEVYVRRGGRIPGREDSDIVGLSVTLNKLQRALGASGDTLRNVDGIRYKLVNFRRFDPTFQHRRGLQHGNKLEPEVWADFASDPPRLRSVALAILARLEASAWRDPFAASTSELEGVAEAPEGRALTVQHLRRERSRAIVRLKKERVFRVTGRLSCEACGFDFGARYGERGLGFIECHHTRPLSEIGEEGRTSLNDLALVCANCHRMIHARRPWLSLESLQKTLRVRPVDEMP